MLLHQLMRTMDNYIVMYDEYFHDYNNKENVLVSISQQELNLKMLLPSRKILFTNFSKAISFKLVERFSRFENVIKANIESKLLSKKTTCP